MIVVELLGRLAPLLLLLPDTGAHEALLVAAVAVLSIAVVVIVSAVRVRSSIAEARQRTAFIERRPLLLATDPSASGHARARAPGAAA